MYRNPAENLVFTDRIKAVEEDVRSRLRPQSAREGTYLICPTSTRGQNPFADVFEEMPDAPYVIALAHAIVRSWLVTPVVIRPHEAVVGITRPAYPLIEHFSWGIQIYEWALSPKEQEKEIPRINALQDRLTPLDRSHIDRAGAAMVGEEIYREIGENHIFHAGDYQGHTLPNYVTLLDNGLDGMLEIIDRYAAQNVKDRETADFYEANRILARGMIAYLEQYASHARTAAETEADPVQKRYYEEIAENCAYVAHKKPKTLYQAVQLAWVLSLWDWVDCLGRIDQFFFPYYEYSKANGDVITPEESVASFMFKIWECGAHNTTIGGCHPADGTDATNELSYLLLQVLRNIHSTHPRMVVRISEDTPTELTDLVLKLWSEGMCDPTVVSDTTVIPGLLKLGVTLEDARNYATLGCQEIEIPGKCNTGCEDGSFNLAKVLEIAMRGGKSTVHPEMQIGPVTKPFTECDTFDELYEGFKEQIRYFTSIHLPLCRKGQECRAANHSKLLKGLFTDGCLEKGIPHDAGGPIYGYGLVETAGLAAAADSLMAIRKLVFDEKRIGKDELMRMLETDFNGFESQRQMLLNNVPKFGNDNPEVDGLAADLLDFFWTEIGKYETGRGGVYTGACSLLEGGVNYGKAMGALPDGRHAGEPLGNTMGPRPGADVSGLTAMLNSVARLPMQKGVGGTTLNVILTTRMLETAELRRKISDALRSFLANGGCMAQITTANKEDLLDAQIHPERHGNLIVRVGGYSAPFLSLTADLQEEIISRYV
ncbi:MAG: hypothetical protein E7658_04665 [Ruminococcaceae bacterium]|nr:hypothetical protein [Oscillospiraceae bacterium]